MPAACLDASLVLTWLLPAQRSSGANTAYEELRDQRYALFAPPLLYVEVPSVLRAEVYFQHLSLEEGKAAFSSFCGLAVESLNHDELHLRAWSLARDLNLTKVYDAQYLAAADLLDCELWTMDKRLINAVGGRFQRLRPIQ